MAVQISSLPTPPTRQDPTNFNDRADAFLSALPTFQSEANALSVEVNNRADNVEASDLAVMAATNITKWVSGTTYAEGAVVWSPINGLGYRRIAASGSGTTDPSLDPTNYKQVNGTGDVSTSGNQTISGVKVFNDNLGLGVTPSAWGPSSAIQFGSNVGNGHAVGKYGLSLNAYYDGSVYRATYLGGASLYQMTATPAVGGGHTWYTAPVVAANSTLTFTQAMTLDASGRNLIGYTSASGSNKLQVTTTTTAYSEGGVSLLCGNGASGVGTYGPRADINVLLSNNWKTNLLFKVNTSDSDTAPVEAARIDSSGNLLVGTVITGINNENCFTLNKSAGWFGVSHVLATASGTAYTNFGYGGNVIGSITQNGTTAVAYNTSSDYRLKHDIAPMQNALQRVAALKPCTYKWNADGSDGEGFIAHELAAVCPQAVTGEKDAVDADGKPVYQGIDTSFLVATLTAAIQEQQKMIEEQCGIIASLTTRIEALEAK